MLYNGVKVYPSYEPLKNDDSTVSVAVYHSSTHQALVDMIERLLHMRASREIFILFKKGDVDEKLREKYSSVSWVEFDDIQDRISVFSFALNETKTEYFLFLDTSYDLLFMDADSLLRVFSLDERTVSVSPYIYTKDEVLFPTLIAPKITRDAKVDSIALCPENTLSANLYPFLLLGMYRKSYMSFYNSDDKKIKDFDCRIYDAFAHLWLMNYRSYMVSFFSLKCNKEFIPIQDKTVNKDVKILSARLLSFYKPRGAKCGLKPFWWLSHNMVTVVRDVLPFLKKGVVDFYTLVKKWKFSLIGTNDLL